MKLAQLVLAVSAAVFSLGLAAAPQVGTPAPDFTVVDSKGNSHSLKDFAGKNVVLEWTNHDCPFVVKHYSGNMQALQAEMKQQDVVWLSVISSAPGKQGHVSGAKADELTASRSAMPTAVVFDESGVVGKAYDAKATPYFANAAKAVLTGKAPDPAVTKPYGCSVKY